jgi:hypothetical protein
MLRREKWASQCDRESQNIKTAWADKAIALQAEINRIVTQDDASP